MADATAGYDSPVDSDSPGREAMGLRFSPSWTRRADPARRPTGAMRPRSSLDRGKLVYSSGRPYTAVTIDDLNGDGILGNDRLPGEPRIRVQVLGGQTAIDLVNDIRTAQGLPQVTYVAAGDATGIQNMLIEEIRRTHFLEGGRFWSAKLRYDLWFPRAEGFDRWNYSYLGGVRMTYPGADTG